MIRHASAISALLGLAFVAACGEDEALPSPSDTSSDTTPGGDTQPGPNDTSANRPPELARIGDRTIALGDTLTLNLSALDPDGDALSYAFYGELPGVVHFDRSQGSFAWNASELGQYSLTFVVSDGQYSDRQTIHVDVSATAQSERPRFAPLSDVYLAPGSKLDLTLRAYDPNGDTLRYSLVEAPEDGVVLDAQTGALSWQPRQAPVCQPLPFTVSVSDGKEEDRTTFKVIVGNGSTECPAPPVWEVLSSQHVAAGDTLRVALHATDPNGDAVQYRLLPPSPDGAALQGNTFTWSSPVERAGQTEQFWLAASDGALQSITPLKVTVTPPAWRCEDDAFEPNDTVEQARRISPGTLEGTLCENADEDLFLISLAANQRLHATLSFDASIADLDMALYAVSGVELAYSDTVHSPESLVWTSTTAAEVLLYVYPYTLEVALPYSLQVSITDISSCQEDPFEPNDDLEQATPFTPQIESTRLQICASDSDFFSMELACGEQIEALLDIQGSADLDLYLYGPGDRVPREGAFTEDSLESLTYGPISEVGTWFFEVQGYPFESAQAPYELLIDRNGACVDSVGKHDSAASAKRLNRNSDASGILCCEEDWFRIEQGGQTQLTLELLGDGIHDIELVVLDAQTQRQVGWLWSSPEGGELRLYPTGANRALYVVLSGQVHASYVLALH